MKRVFVVLLGALAASACFDDVSDGSSGITCDADGHCFCVVREDCAPGHMCVGGVCTLPDHTAGDTDSAGGTTGNKPIPDVGTDMTGSSGTTGGGTGSCAGLCGGDSDGCFCDPICLTHGDCCEDYEVECPGQCLSNYDCGASEVCSSSSQECVPAFPRTYDVWIESWQDLADVCWDTGACYSPDPFFKIFLDDNEVFRSVTRSNSGSSTGWDVTEAAQVTIQSNQIFMIEMWDEDLTSHDWILTWCTKNSQDECVALGEDILHEGRFSDYVSGAGDGSTPGWDYLLDIRFRPL